MNTAVLAILLGVLAVGCGLRADFLARRALRLAEESARLAGLVRTGSVSRNEQRELRGQIPPRQSPPVTPPMADTLGYPGTIRCDEHYYDGCPNCGRKGTP